METTINEVAPGGVARRERNEAVGVPPVADPVDVSRAWFRIEGAQWRCLAVVPAHTGLSAADAASGLFVVASAAGQAAFVDARGVTATERGGHLATIERHVAADRRVIVLVDSPEQTPGAQAVARRCDAAILCVEIGSTRLSSAQRTMEDCGRERFLGAIVVKGGGR